MAKRSKQKLKKKKKNQLIVLGCVILSISCLFFTFKNVSRYMHQRKEYAQLVVKRDALSKEKKELKKQITQLGNEEFIIRYARDHFIFSKEGEDVIKLPKIKE